MASDFAGRFRQVTARRDEYGVEVAHDPFPWQMRLFDRLVAGDLPGALDLPTGLGKTSVMAIWLLARAAGADLPRRLIYVVDRRAVVDQASTEAELLRDNTERLGWPEAWRPKISTLRGAHIDNRDWLADPAAPAIVVGTIDMIGSRLLFEGYGVSRRMRSFHAGLIGIDSFVVLDEAHLVPPFQALVDAVATDPHLTGRQALPIPRGNLTVLALSATGRQSPGGTAPFRLDPADLADATVNRRLTATKALQRRDIPPIEPKTDLATALAAAALELAQAAPAPILIYSDSRAVAEAVRDQLAQSKVPDAAVDLMVGGRRLWERRLAEAALQRLGFQAGGEPLGHSTYLIATSAGEVGVDLDAGHMVCDLVSWERMVQRLGRVNRRGERDARVIVCDQGLAVTPSGVPLASVRALLAQLPAGPEGTVRAGPGALADLARAHPALVVAASTPAPLRPALNRALVEAWALTGIEDHSGRPEIAPCLRGWIEDEPQLRLVWRTHLPSRRDPAPGATEIDTFFDAAPPHLTEGLETEAWRARALVLDRAKALAALAAKARTPVPGPDDALPPAAAPGQGDTVVFALAPDGKLIHRYTLGDLIGFAGPKTSRPQKAFAAFERLAEVTLVLDARLGGLAPSGLADPGAGEPPRTADTDAAWADVIGFAVRAAPAESALAPGERVCFTLSQTAEGAASQVLVVAPQGSGGDGTEDHRAFARTAQTLVAHADQIVAEVRRLGHALGLPARWVDLLEHAARLHDAGKAATVWQTAMAPGLPISGGPYAKTPRGDGRKLSGYRHEFGSLLVALTDPAVAALALEDRDLVLHLIAAHHGHARPGLPVQGVSGLWPPGVSQPPTAPAAASAQASGPLDAPPSVLERHALDAALRFARLQDQWGPWGLAWWETLLRAADQAASRAADQGGTDG